VALSGAGLPAWCDRYLAAPGQGEFFAGRLWYDLLLGHALPAGAAPLLALGGRDECLALPLLRLPGGTLRCLAGPYSLDWRPLVAAGTAAAELEPAAQAVGRLLRWRAPVTLDTLDPAAPGLAELQAGLGRARLLLLRYDHAGNWHEALPEGLTWEAYLAARPPALRTTIRRKLDRAARAMAFEPAAAPGAALEAGIAGYEAVRARSWKPDEPFPDFDAALIRATAAAGLLRLGLLRARADGRPAAAQYWVLDQGGRRAVLLKLAHAEDQRAASPGTVLTAMMVRRLIEEDGVTELDFGIGDDAYKALWVGVRRQRIGLAVLDPLHPAGLAALARHAAGRLRDRLRRGRDGAA
jgi:CelD/BcsL family acetyltransferase involved in cellulose biosynthesis